MSLSLNIGKDADGDWFLVIANPDTDETFPVAQFFTENHATAFTKFMESEGYLSLKLPTQEDLDKLLDGQ